VNGIARGLGDRLLGFQALRPCQDFLRKHVDVL